MGFCALPYEGALGYDFRIEPVLKVDNDDLHFEILVSDYNITQSAGLFRLSDYGS